MKTKRQNERKEEGHDHDDWRLIDQSIRVTPTALCRLLNTVEHSAAEEPHISPHKLM